MVTRAEYAQRRDVSWDAVNRRCQSRSLTLIDGKWLDPAACDEAWPAIDRVKQANRADAFRDGDSAIVDVDGETININMERALHERAKRLLAEHKLAEHAGEFVTTAEARQAFFERARATRDGILAVPESLSADLAAETDARKVHAMLTAALHAALSNLSRDGDEEDPNEEAPPPA
jgi:hypothetical protein